jgi:hypothetical protein
MRSAAAFLFNCCGVANGWCLEGWDYPQPAIALRTMVLSLFDLDDPEAQSIT